ncbi:Oidioi.mRNA.OKI2018_I69.YSR.g17092.t1.cds [Oikopleura dioica]|uniref:Oidioi.mRNA.OKI2018_I69.YSR.g17092.t1.cds n=1 Tax=Oikopleura dioica TaxID=34765 RepID=A0ABN7SI57_OIKDI|nr:Oidioi.mRNA.OKI2018_I69.YSR.g17092.t1.cds [Oikopleura dioica]
MTCSYNCFRSFKGRLVFFLGLNNISDHKPIEQGFQTLMKSKIFDISIFPTSRNAPQFEKMWSSSDFEELSMERFNSSTIILLYTFLARSVQTFAPAMIFKKTHPTNPSCEGLFSFTGSFHQLENFLLQNTKTRQFIENLNQTNSKVTSSN